MTERRTFAGVDPGHQSGGIAIVDSLGNVIATTSLMGTKTRPMTDRDLFDLLVEHSPSLAMLERVHSMPRQGVSSAFKFGASFGTCRTLLTCALVPFEQPTPGQWQKAMQCLSGGDKRVTRDAAQRMFPDAKVTHANADALLLAEHARRTYAARRLTGCAVARGSSVR